MPQELEVTSVTVGGLLEKLRTREWMIPAFQRDFVWSVSDVSSLVHSILERRPIGMATLWQQPDESALPLEPVSIPDNVPETRENSTPLRGAETPPDRRYAVLDGRQRCTAIAMAFGGLKSRNRRFRFSGRFYLNVTQNEEAKRIEFIKETDVLRQGLDRDSVCIGKGLFPLSSSNWDESLMQQFYRYTQAITDSNNYPDGQLPDSSELSRRNKVLAKSFDGLISTKLAVYIVPSSYSLADICEIFEVLNTTGTKVSTVDLIHSWLYSESVEDDAPILLRDWIDSLGERNGALGWSSSSDRPELIAQMVTACHVALEDKPQPRAIGRHQQVSITSVKSGDLLATPTEHWRNILSNENEFTRFLLDFQTTVAGGPFPWSACPYPITSAIYVGLRWHHRFDADPSHPWEISDLNSLFRAFFWRNALSGRYDQGFLTQLGTDISKLKEFLRSRRSYANFGDWAEATTAALERFMNKPVPSQDELLQVASGRQTGALQKALLLPIYASAHKDLLNPEIDISFPNRTDTQLHHIYPLSWCRNNRTGSLSTYLDPNQSDRDWVNAATNLMPLSRESNLEWRAANPGAILLNRGVSYARSIETFRTLFITEAGFEQLIEGADGIPGFWKERAETIAAHITQQLQIYA